MNKWDFDDFDESPCDPNEDWVHVDNLPDFYAIDDKLKQLMQMIEKDGTKAELLLCLDEAFELLHQRNC